MTQSKRGCDHFIPLFLISSFHRLSVTRPICPSHAIRRCFLITSFHCYGMLFAFTRASTLSHRMEVEASLGGETALVVTRLD